MIFKKNVELSEVSGVQMVNGNVAFKGVNLNVYSFVTDGVLIDTGAKSLEKEFQLFFDQQEIDQVMITHHHEDHTGGAAYLQQLGKPIYMHERYIKDCHSKADYLLYRKLFWGKRPPFHAEPMKSTFSSRGMTWESIHTPGHAEDHMSFLNKETGQLFTGDLYCQERTKVVLRDESIPTLINSLQRVLTYDFKEVYCNHAGYLENGRDNLNRKLDYLLELQSKIISLHNKGLPPKQINNILFSKKYPIVRFSMGEWDSLHMVTSVIKDG
ncbi:MBL fold metallo-hydrolase [Paenisporosarcina sp. NPDC076898]|uniref:MBL fold metallo-hydrolase n=1 Tax=unclassified Paenisporosarcina TaxID=2642018 RepID=UPI003D055CCE